MRAERNIGLSEALNELARVGLTVPSQRTRFVQRTFPISARIDVTNVGDTLEYLEGPSHRWCSSMPTFCSHSLPADQHEADTDFARFTELTWVNPVSPRA